MITRSLISYFRYFFKAKTKFEVHSPFVFQFIKEVLEDDRNFYAFTQLQRIRENLLLDDRTIAITDFGAGSVKQKGDVRSIKSIAKTAVSPIWKGKFLFRLINFYKPVNLLELGTSLGITTLYQALPSQNNKMVTIEGCPEIAKMARKHFTIFPEANITLIEGQFKDHLHKAISQFGILDFVFFDGNHKKEPTLAYFRQCLEAAHEKSIFVFDDIHWSDDMEDAWDEIKQHPEVMLTIDLFYVGLVFFREELLEPQHYTLIESWKKPWSMGFFSSKAGG